LFVATVLVVMPRAASAHFLWITIDPPAVKDSTAVHGFFSETPEPESPEFLKIIRGQSLTVDGQALPLTVGEESLDGRWVGALPRMIDAERDLGVRSKDGEAYHLVYTARSQTMPSKVSQEESGDKLRARVVKKDGKDLVEVLFNGKPVANARIKVYPEVGDPNEVTADENGLASIDGLSEGKAPLWANWVEQKPGEIDGKSFTETRYYATLTYRPIPTETADPAATTTFAVMPDPAVNSFGGAVLGDWLYVYGGHAGKMHHYDETTTVKLFRRLNLKDRTTWETLPMAQDVQGVALVSDGKFLYRLGGMVARNHTGEDEDLHSVTDFARFDPETKTWTDLAPLPLGRSTHDAAVVGRTVFAVGGWTMKGATADSEYLEDTVAFDLDHPEAGWRVVEQPFQRRALSVAECGGKLYALGGLTDTFTVERGVEVYDPATKSWASGPELPDKGKHDGFGTSAFSVDGRLYYSGMAGRIFRLNDQGDAWEAVGAWSKPRLTHRLLAGPNHALLAVGGNFKGRQTPVIEAVSFPPAESDSGE
jgi:hypothetical protein